MFMFAHCQECYEVFPIGTLAQKEILKSKKGYCAIARKYAGFLLTEKQL